MEKILEKKLLEMVEEDLGFCDVTTSFTPEKKVSAQIVAKEAGIVSGMHELSALFRMFDIKAAPKVRDGAKIKKSQILVTLHGSSRDILVVERTALNILSRMSGISTLTRAYVDKAREANPKIKVAATRKTTPFFAYFEKKAVKNGGGDTHRLGLGDEVLIKDNHLKLFGSVPEALKAAVKETSFAHKIEIEISRVKDAVPAAASGADVIMLDNMTPEQIKKAAALLEKWGLRKKVMLEASGGITLENIREYAKTGADVLSIGRLTHSAPALDVSLKIL
ncbi:MAG: carboxylating nicotinate-nucleotide diphosphorylase [Candidatus Altiarchaeota archaeon]|nr:carboxylating nicotinate-nucleotide diphosphorylase [Candidatus Altiarchaeota archaeon]